MLLSIAWRNLRRNLRRTLLTGGAVAFAVTLSTCMRGLQDGGYSQMIDQAVRSRLAHLQIHSEGYLRSPDPGRAIGGASDLIQALQELEHVEAVAPRALCEGVAARDSFTWSVEVVGIDPDREAQASIVSRSVLQGERGEEFCRQEQSKALRIFGNDQELFDRWCAAAARGRYLTAADDRMALVGARVAKRLLVSVGDEVTLQVVRAVDSAEQGGEERGALSQRRFEVAGIVRTGNPEIDDRLIYVPLDRLTAMLGTDGPNELALRLDDIDHLDLVRGQAVSLTQGQPLEVHTWYERAPMLKSLIDTDSQMGVVMLIIVIVLVSLGVINTTLMSVLERTREFGTLLAVGMKPSRLFGMVMTEVAVLGAVSVVMGGLLGGAFEVYGRVHGWPIEWITDADLSEMSFSGGVIDPVYHSGLEPAYGAIIIFGVYFLFLAAGLIPAIRASRLKAVAAMRES